jgi:hypothetical protein
MIANGWDGFYPRLSVCGLVARSAKRNYPRVLEDFVSHADRKPVRVEPPAVDPGRPTATGDQRLPAAAALMVFASGSDYGHRGLAPTRPVIVPLTGQGRTPMGGQIRTLVELWRRC